MADYLGFGAYQPTRWQRIKRRTPTLTIRHHRGAGWTA